jgi:FkbM family methyltransferase
MHSLRLPGNPDVTGYFEDEAGIRAAYWQVQPGEVVVDVGCHIGSYTIPALIAGAVVYAVDPSAAYTSRLVSLCELNGLDLARLTVASCALSAPGGYTPEFRAKLDAAPYPEHHAGKDARYSTLDQLTEGFSRLDRIKIDVEGAEFGVLQGGAETLRRYRPQLLIEDHTDVYDFAAQMGIRDQCTALLDRLGYTTELVRYDNALTPSRGFIVGIPVTGIRERP